MKANLTNKGLKEIVNDFDLFYIDIWGVIHNGIKLNEDAVNVLSKLDDLGKEYVLLTNAPRPKSAIKTHLEKMNITEDYYDDMGGADNPFSAITIKGTKGKN